MKENYAGRDIKSLPKAIDRLMTDVNRHLTAQKPDVLAASKQFWNVLFSVSQVSVRQKDIPAAHQAKLREMLDFCLAHRDTLMKGELRPIGGTVRLPVRGHSSA